VLQHSKCFVTKNPKIAQKSRKIGLAKARLARPLFAPLRVSPVFNHYRAGGWNICLNFVQIPQISPFMHSEFGALPRVLAGVFQITSSIAAELFFEITNNLQKLLS
jgi:hypothetical protein